MPRFLIEELPPHGIGDVPEPVSSVEANGIDDAVAKANYIQRRLLIGGQYGWRYTITHLDVSLSVTKGEPNRGYIRVKRLR